MLRVFRNNCGLQKGYWLSIWMMGLMMGCGKSELPIKPVRSDITEALYATGKIFPTGYYRVNSTVPGYLDTLFVQIGDTVEVGQPLFRVKNESLDYALEAASDNLQSATGQTGTNGLKIKIKNPAQWKQAKQKAAEGLTVYAREKGRVFDVAFRQGELVTPQFPVMDIGGLSGFETELLIDETDMALIKVGQAVQFRSEAYPKQVFTGKIKQVIPKIGLINKSIKAIASIDLPAGLTVFAGTTVEANIICSEVKSAWVIPRIYVRNDTVWVKKAVGRTPVKIKTGVSDVERVEVLEGLTEQDELVKPK